MEQSQPIIIPTRSRQKISHHDSYPIGAEKISLALANTGQLGSLTLHFRPDYRRKNDARQYPFLQVLYSSFYADLSTRYLDRAGQPLFGEWQIEVFPVPRPLRQRIHQYIAGVALVEIRLWLDKHFGKKLQGTDILAFFYDEETEECTMKRENHLQPVRVGA